MQLQMVCGGGRGWGGAVGSLSRAGQVARCKPPSMRTASLGLSGIPPTHPHRRPRGGTVRVLASSEVKTAQKPGRKDLLGVNTAFPLKIKFCLLMFF